MGYSLPGSFTDEYEFHPIRPQAQSGLQVIPGLSERYHKNLFQKQNDLMTVMVEQYRHSLVPPRTLTKFSGDPIEHNTLIRGFESQIERRLLSNDTRIRYLEQYLEYEPKELIKGCLRVDAN